MSLENELNIRFKTLQQMAVVNIRHTSNLISNFQNSFMAEFDISMPQFNILRILRGAGEPLNVHTVKERMIEKSPNTTRLMDKLIDKGLIDRVRCESDRRVVYVTITEEGLDVLKKIDESPGMITLFPTSLSDEEAQLLCQLLDKLREEYK
ncbi:MAG TPA: MarR family transcriptional regulator [Taishania sp.]|nr:MarR family transcriptional regulator [Taishania sp.]